MSLRPLAVAVLAAAALTPAACGEDAPSSSGAAGSTSRPGLDAASKRAMLDLARCMREHGVDMPDPQFSGGGGRVQQMGPDNANPATVRAAEKACKSYQDKIKPPALTEAQKEEFKKSALENSRCMREHGIDMPDPQFGADGRVTMKIDKASGIDPDSAKFRAAQKACGSKFAIGSKP
jgi:hypothetical protein